MSLTLFPENAKQNAKLLLAFAKDKPLYFVLKANAYGHGLAAIAPRLVLLGEGRKTPPRFAVAKIKEALAFLSLLPRGLSYRPVLLLLSPVDDPLPLLAHPKRSLVELHFSVHSQEGALLLSRYAQRAKAEGLLPKEESVFCEIKIETGMHRLGFEEKAPLWTLFSLPSLSVCGLFSHLGNADSPDSPKTALQSRAFSRAAERLYRRGLLPFTHLAASAALLRHGFMGQSGARTGLLLYGASPFSPLSSLADVPLPALLPVKRLSGRVLCVREVKRGESVGYGLRPLAADTRVAVLDVGYAEGLPPTALGAHALLHGRAVSLCGSVCMEKCFLDIGDLSVKEGDEAVFYGESPKDTARFAAECGLSPHALLATGTCANDCPSV